jgi:hypothetical protein
MITRIGVGDAPNRATPYPIANANAPQSRTRQRIARTIEGAQCQKGSRPKGSRQSQRIEAAEGEAPKGEGSAKEAQYRHNALMN